MLSCGRCACSSYQTRPSQKTLPPFIYGPEDGLSRPSAVKTIFTTTKSGLLRDHHKVTKSGLLRDSHSRDVQKGPSVRLKVATGNRVWWVASMIFVFVKSASRRSVPVKSEWLAADLWLALCER